MVTASFYDTANLAGHMELVRKAVDQSLADPETIQLARKVVNGVHQYIEHPKTGQRTAVIEAWGDYFWAPDDAICRPKDDACELQALWAFLVLNCRYVYDPEHADTFATLKQSLLARGGDCFPAGTLLLTDDYRLTPVEHLRAGQKIWGRDRWSEVGSVWPKGVKAITSIRLNNGSWLRLTDEHKVYIAECPRHARGRKSGPCACPFEGRTRTRITVAELEPGMTLVQPDSITVPRHAHLDREMAWLDGAYLAEGWVDGRRTDKPSRFCISGRDGHPKEATKARVQALMRALGHTTRWHERYIAVNEADYAQRYSTFGKGAANKRIPDLGAYDVDGLEGLLEGLLLDASKNSMGRGYTFGSVSRELAVQVRVIARMLGRRTGWSTVADHGGMGSHPIHRVTVPDAHRDGDKAPRLLRVKEVLRVEGDEQHTWDVQTDDHYVYLPEHDVTVSNCDDAAIAFCALARAIGFGYCVARVISVSGDEWEHVYPIIGCPKDHPQVWVPLDITVEGMPPGWQVPEVANAQDFPMSSGVDPG